MKIKIDQIIWEVMKIQNQDFYQIIVFINSKNHKKKRLLLNNKMNKEYMRIIWTKVKAGYNQ
jgi:hypothetical protein